MTIGKATQNTEILSFAQNDGKSKSKSNCKNNCSCNSKNNCSRNSNCRSLRNDSKKASKGNRKDKGNSNCDYNGNNDRESGWCYEGSVFGLARSQARQRYQLATEHQGCHFFARRCISSGLGRSMGVTLSVGLSLPKVRAKPLRTP